MSAFDNAVRPLLTDLAGRAAPSETDAGRCAAAARFLALGLPTLALENWKYTNLAPLSQMPFRVATNSDAERFDAIDLSALALAAESDHRLIILNGHIRLDLSRLGDLPAGVEVGRLSERPAANNSAQSREDTAPDEILTALNTALMHDGVLIKVAPDTVVDAPLHIVFVGTDRAGGILRNPRVVIELDRHAELRVIEEYVSAGSDCGLTNAVSDILLADGAKLDHHRLQTESTAASHVGRVSVEVGRDARFLSDSVAFGGNLTRVDITVRLIQRGATCRLNGLFVADGEQHIDHHTRIEHVVGDTHSVELYRGILDGRSRGVFNGKVIVNRQAQQISARQTSNNLLLSRQAEIDTKPELEIYADDVICTHGATVGELDRAALFYLRSRGIPEAEARALLTYAFAEQVVKHMPVAGIRRWIERRFLGHTRFSELQTNLNTP